MAGSEPPDAGTIACGAWEARAVPAGEPCRSIETSLAPDFEMSPRDWDAAESCGSVASRCAKRFDPLVRDKALESKTGGGIDCFGFIRLITEAALVEEVLGGTAAGVEVPPDTPAEVR